MFKITNISGNLTLNGLYPGESKNIKDIDNVIRELYDKQLLSITKIDEPIKKKNEENVANTSKETNIKDCEVLNTDGRN